MKYAPTDINEIQSNNLLKKKMAMIASHREKTEKN